MLFLEYPKCSTCKKEKKWLDEQGISYEDRHIIEDNPTVEELKDWHERSGLAAVCLVICAIAALRFCFGYVQVIQAYKQGNYKSVEGYVENFIPASSGGEDQEDMEEESFDIKGVHFSYGDKFIKKFGYHRPSTQGGYIKKDGQYLKIGYISTEKGYVIVKIQERK